MTIATTLQKKIQRYLDLHQMPTAAFERKAGLKVNVARNILKGQSKRPTSETLKALARAMNCRVHDLLEDEVAHRYDKASLPLEYPELLGEAVQAVLSLALDKNKKLSMNEAFRLAKDVYSYGLNKNPPHVDHDFVRWILERP